MIIILMGLIAKAKNVIDDEILTGFMIIGMIELCLDFVMIGYVVQETFK